MRPGLAAFAAAAVCGGYLLVNSISSRPEPPGAETPAAQAERSWLPSLVDEPEAETRTYELIRYVTKDGSVGMVDDPRRVPPGAKIIGRERRTVAIAKPAPAEPEPEDPLGGTLLPPEGARRLSGAEQRLMKKVLETGVFPDASQLEEMQDDLDELERERAADRTPR